MRNRLVKVSAVLAVLSLSTLAARGAEDTARIVAPRPQEDPAAQSRFLTHGRQVTFEGRRAGEGYFNPDGSMMIFQSEREPGNPFFQIYRMDLGSGDVRRISPGYGKTTCSWFFPDGRRVIFASTHEDPDAKRKQDEELTFRVAGKRHRYAWDYDERFDIYAANVDGTDLTNLTHARGYDAEGAVSPDGKLIVFTSNRHAYEGELSPADQERLERDASYFLDIYTMHADGSNVQRLTDVPGYDGGPFFSFDGRKICWRRFQPDAPKAEIWTMNADGSDQKQITRLGAMSWAPFFHPSGDYLIFSTNLDDPREFELYIVDAEAAHDPVRVTYTPGFDGLPAFLPHGDQIAWTSNRTVNKQGQVFFADWNDAEARRQLGLGPPQASPEALAQPSPHRTTETEVVAAEVRKLRGTLLSELDKLRRTGDSRPLATRIGLAFAGLELQPLDPGTGFLQPTGSAPADSASKDAGWHVIARLPTGADRGAPAIVVAGSFGVAEDAASNRSVALRVAATLEVARYLSVASRRGQLHAERNVIIAIWDAARFSLPELIRTLGQSNEDQASSVTAYIEIGTLDGPRDALEACGLGSSRAWRREIERRNVPVGLAIHPVEAVDPHSLAKGFYDRNVPVLEIRGVTEPAPSDSAGADFDEYALAARTAKLVWLIVRSLATQAEPPAFTPIETPATRPSATPYLGTHPDYAPSDTPGVKLTGISPGSPAERAGLRAGDLLIRLNHRDIRNVQEYAEVLFTLEAGATVPLTVVREGQTIELTVTVGARE